MNEELAPSCPRKVQTTDRVRSICVAFVFSIGGVLGSTSVLVSNAAHAATATFTPVADTFVQADQPDTNFGKFPGIRVDGSPETNGYVQFNISVPAGEVVTRATLKLFTTSSSGSGLTAHKVASTPWGEAGTTYSNAPAIGARVAASGSYPGNAYVAVNVTRLVNRNGLVTIAIKRTSTNSNTYNSREASSNRPQLIVESATLGEALDGTLVFAVGDGADGSRPSRDLAEYINAENPDRFFYLGDVYQTGTAAEFANNYERRYGAMAARTDPAIGNHEYANRSTGYFPYWMEKRGWTEEEAKHRSYVDEDSGWQIIVYSSEEPDMEAEGAWVEGVLAEHAGTCRILIAHKGRHVVADTSHGDNTNQEPVWRRIVGKAAINLIAHNHIYGRLYLDGVHVIVSGAGGHQLRSLGSQHHKILASRTGLPTATALLLRRGAAHFKQVDRHGRVYDAGTIACTPAPASSQSGESHP